MRRSLRSAVHASAAVLACSTLALAQSDFQWRGPLGPGQTVEIKGVNGDVRAVPSSGGDVQVTATRTARRSNPADVRIEVVPHAGGVTICAVYPDVPDREPNTCEPGSGGRSNTRNNDVVVQFIVQVPPGIGFVGRTVNGSVRAELLQGDVEGYTVNGSVTLATAGLVRASTVNGSISATMGRADWNDGANFRTVNGDITLKMPSVLNADLRADTVNGSISTDFPITVTGRVTPRRLAGTVGSGGRELSLSTVNGSIQLLKSQ